AQDLRLRMYKRRGILQLIAESVRAAGLVVAAARPVAAGERLIDEPTVDEHVERGLGRAHLHRAERLRPELLDGRERFIDGARHRETPPQFARFVDVLAGAEPKHDIAFLAVLDFERHLDRGTGVEPRADLAG